MLHVHESSCVSARVFLKIGMSIKMNTARFEVWHLFLKKPPLLENPLCQLYLWMKPDNGKKLWNYQLLLYVQKFNTEPTAASTTAVLNLRIYLHTKSTNLELSLHAYNKYIFF